MVMEVGPYQEWMQAFDRHEHAKRRWEAANALGDQGLINYTRSDLDQAAQVLRAAIRALKS